MFCCPGVKIISINKWFCNLFSIKIHRDSIWYFLSFFYIVSVFLGYVDFSLWGQVDYIHSTETRLAIWLHHPHFTRYLLVYPVYLLADHLKTEPNYIFSVLVSLLIIHASKLTGKTIEKFIYFKRARSSSLLLFVVLSFFMNGRIVFPLVAMAMLMLLLVRWWFGYYDSVLKTLCAIIIIFWLSSVSSGTFSVVYILLIYWLAELLFHIIKQQSISNTNMRLLFSLLISISLLLPPFFVFLRKNLSYYGADLLNFMQLLQHGFGTIFFQFSTTITVLLILLMIVGGINILYILIFLPKYRPLLAGVLIGVAGGSFGYSTLAMALPPVIVLFIVSVVSATRWFIALNSRQSRVSV